MHRVIMYARPRQMDGHIVGRTDGQTDEHGNSATIRSMNASCAKSFV